MNGQTAEAAVDHAERGQPIDLVHLDRATFGNRVLRREILRLFERQAVRLAAEILSATDERARSDMAHGLRGAALGVGANAVAAAAGAIEGGIEAPVELTGALARLAARVAEARLAIGDLLAKD